MALLEVKDISKSFGGLQVVQDITFSVDSGQIVSLIGTNGAGKTTCFNMVSGFTPVDSGHIMFEGRDITDKSAHEVSRLGMVRTFQHTTLFAELTVLENVIQAMDRQHKISYWSALTKNRFYRKALHDIQQVARQRLDEVGLKNKERDKARSLAYGDQRRLAVAIAMAANPKLVLLDEPAAGLNPTESHELMNIIRYYRDMGKAILLVEHDMRLVMDVSDRVIVMDQGRKCIEGTPEEVRTNEEVIRIYLGRGGERRRA